MEKSKSINFECLWPKKYGANFIHIFFDFFVKNLPWNVWDVICKINIFSSVVMLLEGKTYDMYLTTFQFIKSLLPMFSQKVAMADWELAACQAATAIWPDLQVKGCYFHFSQNVFKNLQVKGLLIPYKSNLIFKKWV